MTTTNTNYKNWAGGNKAVIHLIANETIIVAGNSAVSNIASNSSATVVSADIASVTFGSQGGTWLILRSDGSANVIVGAYYGSGQINHAIQGMAPVSQYNTANLTFQLVGTANGFIQVDLNVRTTYP